MFFGRNVIKLYLQVDIELLGKSVSYLYIFFLQSIKNKITYRFDVILRSLIYDGGFILY